MSPTASRADTPSRRGLRAVLAHAGYRRLWAARTVSQAGDVAQFTTLALLVLHLTGSGVGVSGAVLAEIAPVLLLAPLAGPLVDRLPRVTVMITADLVRVVLAAVLAVWHTDIAVVYAIAFGLSAGSVFFNPAAGSLLPTLVPDEDLVAANSGIWSAAVLIQIALAPAAGLLAVTAGYTWAFAANAASYAISATLLHGLRSTEKPRPITTSSIFTQGREALTLLTHDQLLRALAIAQALAALSAGATSALLVVLAADRLHTSGPGYGLLITAIGIGAGVRRLPGITGASRSGQCLQRKTHTSQFLGLLVWAMPTGDARPGGIRLATRRDQRPGCRCPGHTQLRVGAADEPRRALRLRSRR